MNRSWCLPNKFFLNWSMFDISPTHSSPHPQSTNNNGLAQYLNFHTLFEATPRRYVNDCCSVTSAHSITHPSLNFVFFFKCTVGERNQRTDSRTGRKDFDKIYFYWSAKGRCYSRASLSLSIALMSDPHPQEPHPILNQQQNPSGVQAFAERGATNVQGGWKTGVEQWMKLSY